MTRQDKDRYPSEPAMLDQLLERVVIGRRQTILEPTAGSGQLAGPLRQLGYQVITNDIAYGAVKWRCQMCDTMHWTSELGFDDDDWLLEECSKCGSTSQRARESRQRDVYNTDYHLDAATTALWKAVGRVDWIIGNPPFNQLEDILELALPWATYGVAFIMRLTALEPTCTRSKRGEIMEAYADNLRYVMPFSGPRPSFTDDGKTDSVTTAWFVWMRGHSWSNFVGIQSPFQFIMNWKK